MSHDQTGRPEVDDSVEKLLAILDFSQLGPDHFRADTDQQEGRLFGGLILAQSIVAAGRTGIKGNAHSLHAYFLRAGRPATPVEYRVERVREGRTFTTRRVSAYQSDDMIFEASISFTLPEEGIAHQEPMPEAPEPEALPSWWSTLPRGKDVPRPMRRRWPSAIDIRGVDDPERQPAERLPHRTVWGRVPAPIPDDPIIHAAFMAYFSDSGLVSTVAGAYGAWGGPTMAVASLDHAIWWHKPPRFDDWILYSSESPAASNGRGVIFASMYSRAGVRLASVAQECLVRTTPAT